jgi:hypothetical protein
MEWIINNWSLIITVVAVVVYFLLNGKRSVVEFLLQAVVMAEKDLGSGTGKIKLSVVYGNFIEKYPIFSKIIPFPVFSAWVDAVLEDMKDILSKNEKAKAYVENEKEAL